MMFLAVQQSIIKVVEAGFEECEDVDATLKECTDAVLAGDEVNTCTGEYRAAAECNLEVLEDLEEISGIEDCSGFYDAWEPFITIDNCPDASETGLSCENLPYSCGNTCVNGQTCFNAALRLNECMRNQGGDKDVDGSFLGPCGNTNKKTNKAKSDANGTPEFVLAAIGAVGGALLI